MKVSVVFINDAFHCVEEEPQKSEGKPPVGLEAVSEHTVVKQTTGAFLIVK